MTPARRPAPRGRADRGRDPDRRRRGRRVVHGRARPAARPGRRHRRPDAPSTVYLEQILRGCAKVGIDAGFVELEGEATEASVVATIRELNADPTVDGVIVQMPLPPTIRLRAVIDAIDPAKDIDGIHPLNAGLLRLGYDGFLPATAHAAVEILRRSGIEIAGRDAVVIGRSAVVGMPAAFLLVKEDATVTVCHSRTRDLAGHVRRADIVVVAAGQPGPRHRARCSSPAPSSSTSGSTSSTAGSSATSTSTRRVEVASAITPVPGGVGPLTNALLLTHLIRAAERHATADRAEPAPAAEPVRRAPRRPMSFPSDLEIARSVTPRPIVDIAARPRASATTSSSSTARPRPR